MCSSDGNNRVLDIKRSGNALASGMNVQIYTVSDTTAQQFKFTHYGQGKYVITPKANTSLFLTANGNSNGSSSGKSSTSAGNVYISSMLGEEDGLPVASNYQLWTIETVQNEMTLASGCYRIRNKNSGKYMTATANNTVSQKNRDEATIWEIVYTQVGTDGYYCIYIANGNDMGITSNLSYSSALIYPSIANISYIINTDYMMFIIKNADDTDSYRIASRDGYNSTTMTVFTGSTAEDAQVCETGYTGNNSQRWIFESVYDDGDKHILSAKYSTTLYAGLFLNEEEITDYNDTYVKINYKLLPNDSQCWRVENVANGYHKITNESTGLCLTVEDNVVSEGAAVKVDYYDGLDGQLWRIQGTPDNAQIVSKLGDDLSYYSTNNYKLSYRTSVVNGYSYGSNIMCLTKIQNNNTLWDFSYKGSFWYNSMFLSDDYRYDGSKPNEEQWSEEKILYESQIYIDSAKYIKEMIPEIIDPERLIYSESKDITTVGFETTIEKNDFSVIYNHGVVKKDSVTGNVLAIKGVEVNSNKNPLNPQDDEGIDTSSYVSLDKLESLDLYGVDLLIWFPCSSGFGGKTARNMASISYQQGAEVVLAWNHNLNTQDTDVWMGIFYEMCENYTISKIIERHDKMYPNSALHNNYNVHFGNLDRTMEEILK